MRSRVQLVALVAAVVAGCSRTPAVHTMASPMTATATLRDLQGAQVGTVTLTDSYVGVLIEGTVSGIGLGTHGIHIHEVGQCTAPFATAGGHFNPEKHRHGFKNPEGHHAGDLTNIDTPAAGPLKFHLLLPGVSLGGSNGVLDADGAAIVIHAAADDYMTDPSGGSGGRIACGVITAR